MKLFTTTRKTVYSRFYGKLIVFQFRFLGIKFWSEIHAPKDLYQEITPQQEEKELHDLEEMAAYIEWRKQMKARNLTSDEFEMIMKTRF